MSSEDQIVNITSRRFLEQIESVIHFSSENIITINLKTGSYLFEDPKKQEKFESQNIIKSTFAVDTVSDFESARLKEVIESLHPFLAEGTPSLKS